MKRYIDISYRLARISPLRENIDGEWIKYEDAKKFVRKLLGVTTLNKTMYVDMYVDMFYPKNQQEK